MIPRLAPILAAPLITTSMLTAAPLAVPELTVFNPKDWTAIQSAFASAPQLSFQQAWLEQPSPDLRPATVRIGWRGDRFLFLATLTDDAPATRATDPGQRLWELGDVLEFFAGVKGHPAYIEYHVAPTGLTLELLWPAPDVYRSLKNDAEITRYIVPHKNTRLQAALTPSGWQVYGEIPAAALPGTTGPLPGQTWEISFSRYDYDKVGANPVLSSTSPHKTLAYHRRQEWTEIRFE